MHPPTRLTPSRLAHSPTATFRIASLWALASTLGRRRACTCTANGAAPPGGAAAVAAVAAAAVAAVSVAPLAAELALLLLSREKAGAASWWKSTRHRTAPPAVQTHAEIVVQASAYIKAHHLCCHVPACTILHYLHYRIPGAMP